jgi:MFS family permease
VTVKQNLLILYAANLLYMASFSAYFLLPVYLSDLGASDAIIGGIMSVMGISNLATLLWLYFYGDRRDTRSMMMFGCAAALISNTCMILTTDLFFIACVRLWHGIAFCIYLVSVNTYITQICPPKEHAKHIGFLGVITLVTQAASPAAAEAFVEITNFQTLFALTIFLVVLSVIALFILPRAQTSEQKKTVKIGNDSNSNWLFYGFQVAGVAVVGGVVYGTILVFSPLYLQEKQIVPLSLFFIAYSMAAVISRIIGRNWADHYGRVRISRYAFVALTVSVIIMGWTRNAATFGAVSALFGIGHGLMYPAMAAYSIQVIPGNLRAMTIWTGGFIIGVSIGAALGGVIAEKTDIGTAFMLSAVMPMIAVAALSIKKIPQSS